MNNEEKQKNSFVTHAHDWRAYLILGCLVSVILVIIFLADKNKKIDRTFTIQATDKQLKTIDSKGLVAGWALDIKKKENLDTNIVAQAPIGWLETIDSKGLVAGWALDPDTPASSILIHAYVDGPAGVGKLVGGIPASLSRPDVNEVKKVAGDHGFEFVIPSEFRDNAVHTLFVHGVDTSGDGSQNLLISGVPKSFSLPPVAKDNGIIKVNFFGGGFPMITSLSVLGKEILFHDNAGADLQMDARIDFDVLNPTQGGDCRGVPSRLTGLLPTWSGAGLGIDSSYGVLLGVDPRNYGLFYSCEKFGEITPYNFNFGVTLGDGKKLPKEMMVIDMSMQREEGSSYIPKAGAEMPVGFFKTSSMRFAYGSKDGIIFEPLTISVRNPNGTFTQEHSILLWPEDTIKAKTGKAVMICNHPRAIQQPERGLCVAFFSHFETRYELSHRKVDAGDLTLMSIAGSNDGFSWILDLDWHVLRRVMAVGNFKTVQGVIATAKQKITDWGNW